MNCINMVLNSSTQLFGTNGASVSYAFMNRSDMFFQIICSWKTFSAWVTYWDEKNIININIFFSWNKLIYISKKIIVNLHILSLMFSWTILICTAKFVFSLNDFWQLSLSHLKSLRSEWTEITWQFKTFLSWKFFPPILRWRKKCYSNFFFREIEYTL